MEQVLYNLIYNATQYAYPSTNLRVKAFYDNGYIDNSGYGQGPGFPLRKFHLYLTSSTGLKDQKQEEPDWDFQSQRASLKPIMEQ